MKKPVVQTISLSAVNVSPFNPRRITRAILDKLKKSIEEFGYVDLIIVNKQTMNVVGGNQRLFVLREMGLDEASCIVVDIPLQKEKALNVALNKISGEWDFDKLQELMESLDDDDRELTGFDSSEIDMLVQSVGDVVDPGDIPGNGDSQDDDSVESSGGSSTGPVPGKNIVIYIPFRSVESANAWLVRGGYDVRFPDGKTTMVLPLAECMGASSHLEKTVLET